MNRPLTIGILTPMAQDIVPAEAAQMYPEVRFIAKGIGVRALNPAGYEGAFSALPPAADELARNHRLDALMVLGTSLTFSRGYQAHEELLARLREIGLPTGTMSSAIVDALRAVNARRITVSTAYNDEVNRRLRQFLEAAGFEVLAIEGFGIESFDALAAVNADQITQLVRRVDGMAPDADAVLISCGGLSTLHLDAPLEHALGKPVISSMPAALWSAVRLAGASGTLAGHGTLFAVTR